MNKYEAVFIFDIRKVEDEGEAFTEEFKKLIADWNGNVENAVSMGRKQFVREIGGRKAGIYWNYVFNVTPDKVAAIRDRYRLDDRVVRELIINYDRPEKVSEQIAERSRNA